MTDKSKSASRRLMAGYPTNMTLHSYLKEINKIPLLNRDEERECARRAAQGDQEAREKLIRANLRFVVSVAKRYQNQGMPLTDLIGEGNIGLINAIEHYEVERGYHFISYAVWWIRQAILRALSQTTRMIRLPVNRVDELFKIQRMRRELSDRMGRAPNTAEIARDLHMQEDVVDSLLAASRDPISLEAPLGDESDAGSFADLLADETAEDPEAAAQRRDVSEQIEDALSDLPGRDAEIVRHRFGLAGRRPLTLREVGEMYGLSKERVRQLQSQAISRLRSSAKAGRLRELLPDSA